MVQAELLARRALLIGIDRYPHLPPHQQLNGCVNDVTLMRSLLLDRFGFSEQSVRMIVNEDATRDAVLAALDELVAATQPDDIVVIHYAGHGSQVRDRDGDEADGRDETLVPSDSARPPEPNRDITDDELHLRLGRLADVTPYVTLIFDCCHSGTISRDLSGAKPRQVEPDLRPVDELPTSLPAGGAARGVPAASRGPGGWFPLSERYVLISGCRDDEQSYEHAVETGGQPVRHGAMTYFLSAALTRATPGTTYRDVIEDVRSQVTVANAEQHPQMEGAIDREIFGVRDIETMRFVAVEKRQGATVTLAAGAAHGLRVGSRWGVHPPGAKQADAQAQLGVVTITDVGATRSEATVTEEVTPGAIGERARAVEVARDYGDLRLAVRMEGERSIAPDVWDGIAKAIAESGLLRMADGSAPSVRIVLLPIRAHAGPQDPVPQLGPTAEPVLAVVSETGELMMAPREPGRFAEALKNLEGWAAFRLKLAIDNPGSDLGRGLSLELLRKDATGEWQPIPSDPSGGLRVVGVGDTIEIRLTNQGADTLYAGLFDFRPTGEVKRIFPVGGREPLEPGKSMMLGRGRGFRTSWPSGFPFQPNPFTDTPTQATETLKAFITSEETDFSYLEQGSASRALGGDASPFHRLLAASVSGATRDMEPVPPDDWATLALPFTLSAKTQATLDTAQPLKIGGIEVRADGAQAHIVAHGGERAHRRPGVPTIGRLDEALRSSHVHPVQTLGLDSVKTGSRAAGGEPELELAVAPPATGWGQLVMSTDEVGVVGWHFAEELSPDHVTSRSLTANVSTFRIPMRTVEPADGDTPASRGVVGMVGKKLLKVLVFPLMDPVFGAVGEHFASRFETARRPYGLRSFTPDDYRSEKGAPVDAETWRRLASGRSLLFVHGTFSRAHHAFHAIPPDMMRDLHRIYEGRVFAFDHKTLSDDPKANVTWLLEQLPDGVELNVDIVCHSRGGLVSRVLAERGDELTRTGCRIHVGRVIFVASPNAGTALAHAKHIGEFLERYTNLLNFLEVLPDNGVTDVLDGIITVAKQAAVGAFAGLVGLRAMEPGGAFEKWLAESTPNATRYYAIASDFNPTGPGLRERFMNGLMDKVFEGVPNDLVVPTASVYEGGVAPLFPISERLVLQGVEGVGHSGYFAAPGVQRRIFSWLEAAT